MTHRLPQARPGSLLCRACLHQYGGNTDPTHSVRAVRRHYIHTIRENAARAFLVFECRGHHPYDYVHGSTLGKRPVRARGMGRGGEGGPPGPWKAGVVLGESLAPWLAVARGKKLGKEGIICLFLVSSPQGGLDCVHMGWARHAWRILAWKVPVQMWGKREGIVNLR